MILRVFVGALGLWVCGDAAIQVLSAREYDHAVGMVYGAIDFVAGLVCIYCAAFLRME